MYSSVSLNALRRMVNTYPVARACVNRRIRQITQLTWDVSKIVEDSSNHDKERDIIKAFFKHPMGHKTRMREFLTLMIDDILSIDATCFEYQRKYNKQLMYLVPVDPTTIVLRITETGGVPIPPDPAYAQYIHGQKQAEFTTDEMLYEVMNTKSWTPYGLAPMESLIIQVTSALNSALYNKNYFDENNIPTGFITLPEETVNNTEDIKKWQEWFDQILAGDKRMMHRLKILPNGSEYTPSKKPEDMQFENFELWLLQQTCAVFDVQPQDIGITLNVNRSNGEVQQDIGKEQGLYPLANFIKEIIDEIIQVELGFPDMHFVWIDIDPTNEKEEIEIAEKEINLGALSVDEYRKQKGKEPIGLEHYVKTTQGPVFVKDLISGKTQENEEKANTQENEELKRWRKCLINDLDNSRPLRTNFKAYYIDKDTYATIQKALKNVHSKDQVRMLFEEFLNTEYRASVKLLELASELRTKENAELI